jgi:hypothetical protein
MIDIARLAEIRAAIDELTRAVQALQSVASQPSWRWWVPLAVSIAALLISGGVSVTTLLLRI